MRRIILILYAIIVCNAENYNGNRIGRRRMKYFRETSLQENRFFLNFFLTFISAQSKTQNIRQVQRYASSEEQLQFSVYTHRVS